jgi:hypothetical protein
LKWTAAGVFFTTGESLDSGDTGGEDLYRYDLLNRTSECVTCVGAGLEAGVHSNAIAVAPDGSRAYFASSTALLPGATVPGVYRVNVASGDLAFVAPSGGEVSDEAELGNAITPDGAVFVYAASAPAHDALGGQQNDGTLQYYRYDDRDRSLVCLSCPQDGTAPAQAVERSLITAPRGTGANRTALSADGRTFAFVTPNALLAEDRNTAASGQPPSAGSDVYEWRDGRLLLVTDGLSEWPQGAGSSAPELSAITPSGDDVFFTAAAQYTPDALDGFTRLYDARVGGGFEFPEPPPDCPLEVCLGTPKGAPYEPIAGTALFQGPGNPPSATRRRCRRGKVRRHGRCVRRHRREKR